MAEGDDGQEKTEEPTPKRREKARQDGQVITSKETFVLVSMAGGLFVIFIGQSMLPSIANIWADYLIIDANQSLDRLVIARLGKVMEHTAWAGIIFGIPIMILILLAQGAMGGIIFATKNLGFKIEKINPAKGLKRMVSLQSLVELLKAILKVSLLLISASAVVYPLIGGIINMTYMAPGDSVALFGKSLIRILSAMLIGLSIIATIDLGYQIFSNTKKLKMTRQEIKDENKDSEGSPEVKGKLRQKQFEASQRAAKNRASLDNVGDATAVITNPIHFAVALKYRPGIDVAPTIVAMGKGPLAFEIMDRAKSAKVRTLQVPPLARALYFTGDIDQEINYALYSAVATILAYVYRLDQGDWDEQPDVALPPDLMFNEFGHPQQEQS